MPAQGWGAPALQADQTSSLRQACRSAEHASAAGSAARCVSRHRTFRSTASGKSVMRAAAAAPPRLPGCSPLAQGLGGAAAAPLSAAASLRACKLRAWAASGLGALAASSCEQHNRLSGAQPSRSDVHARADSLGKAEQCNRGHGTGAR